MNPREWMAALAPLMMACAALLVAPGCGGSPDDDPPPAESLPAEVKEPSRAPDGAVDPAQAIASSGAGNAVPAAGGAPAPSARPLSASLWILDEILKRADEIGQRGPEPERRPAARKEAER